MRLSGVVAANEEVSITTATVNATPHSARICYTTDGTAPACNGAGTACDHGVPSAGPSVEVTVLADTTYRAIACRPNYAPSEERTFSYDVP